MSVYEENVLNIVAKYSSFFLFVSLTLLINNMYYVYLTVIMLVKYTKPICFFALFSPFQTNQVFIVAAGYSQQVIYRCESVSRFLFFIHFFCIFHLETRYFTVFLFCVSTFYFEPLKKAWWAGNRVIACHRLYCNTHYVPKEIYSYVFKLGQFCRLY